MISIIIPVYNVEKYIDRCLESVVNQTFTDFEVILIDDGSTDCSGVKCLEWEKKDSRIHVARQQNQGLGPTRNLGVQLSKYEYITFLDSDDWWDVHYLEKMMQPVLQENIDIVCCDIHYWESDENGVAKDVVSELRMPSGEVMSSTLNKELINVTRTFMWGKVFKKNLFIENKIVQPAHAYEDVPITPLLVAKAKKICRVDSPLYYYYRKRQGSLANSVNSLMDMEKSIGELIANFKKENIFNAYREQLKKLVYSQARFIIKKARLLCEDKEQSEIVKKYSDLLEKNFPEIMNIRDKFFIVGNEQIKKAIELIALDEKQIEFVRNIDSDINIQAHGYIIVNLTDVNSEIDYYASFTALTTVETWLFNDEKLKCIAVVSATTINQWQNKLNRYIWQKNNDKIKCIIVHSKMSEMKENQLWDIADRIFYTI